VSGIGVTLFVNRQLAAKQRHRRPIIGVLVEVPVMLSVVKTVNVSKGWYERKT
jgi:ACR3 family arsenite efflux pump ArsB